MLCGHHFPVDNGCLRVQKRKCNIKNHFCPGGYGTDEVKLKPPRLISNTVDIS